MGAIECLRRTIQQRGGSLSVKIVVVPFGVDPCCWALQRENTPGQLNVKLFFSSFPTNVITVLQRQGQTDGRTNRRLAVAMPRSATSA